MAAVGQRYFTPNPFEIDQNGVPLAGAFLFFYQTGTSTPLDTYQDVALTTPNTNPVVADANGRFGTIFLVPSTAYKVVLQNSAAVQIWTEDPVGPASGGAPTNIVGIIGEIRDFAGPASALPSQWYLCFGQAVSRTTFASLFAVIGTLWGAGDGTTTFNLPDLRGRATFGKDDMGGTPAGRLTAGVSGVPGTTIGGTGGDQSLQTHGHALTDPTHTHTVTDPGHTHREQAGQGSGGAQTAWNITASGSTTSGITEFTQSATTGITLVAASTGITLANDGAGSAQNVPPAGVVNKIIYAGA